MTDLSLPLLQSSIQSRRAKERKGKNEERKEKKESEGRNFHCSLSLPSSCSMVISIQVVFLSELLLFGSFFCLLSPLSLCLPRNLSFRCSNPFLSTSVLRLLSCLSSSAYQQVLSVLHRHRGVGMDADDGGLRLTREEGERLKQKLEGEAGSSRN